jgi:aminopeptidase N
MRCRRAATLGLLGLLPFVLATLCGGRPPSARPNPPADTRFAADEGLDPFGIPNYKALWARQTGWGRWSPRQEWDPDSSGYDALHVDLTVEPLFDEEAIIGRVEWTLRVAAHAISSVSFDFFSNMEITAATVDEVPVLFTHTDDRLRLMLPMPALVGDTLRTRIEYHGEPLPGFLVGMRFTDHEGIPVVYTNCEPIASRTWWPCKDRPDDKFTADLSFIVPDTMIAASNGLLIEVLPLERNRLLYHWYERHPVTTYLVSLTATNFATFDDTYVGLDGTEMPLNYYAYPEDLERAMQDWAFTPLAIAFLAQTFGEYPFMEEKYGMVEYPWIGAMEHQTLSSMGRYFFQLDHPSDWVVVHELAHQWWGDWVTCGTWRDIWLNEGFAVYCEALWAEHLAGPDSLRFQMNRFRRDHYSGSVYDPDFIFNSTVYRKGAWVLHMLRHIMGDSTFFEALRYYGRRHAYGMAVTADLQEDCETICGQDLDWFFDQWVYGEGQPRYRVRWDPAAVAADGRTSILITVLQETTGPQYFKMPIDARFVLPGGTEFWTVLWDSLPEQTFLIETPAPPESLDIDPHEWILCKVHYVADPTDVPEAGSDPHAGRSSFDNLTLGAPRPNPTHLGTTVPVYFPSESESSLGLPGDPALDLRAPRLALAIHDAQGRLVRRLSLSDRTAAAGLFHWDGKDGRGHRAPPGFYFARLSAGEAPAVRILLLR